MALQETFRNAKAYSLQNGNDGEFLKKRFIYEVKRLKKDKKLPVVLSKEIDIQYFLMSPYSSCANSKYLKKEKASWNEEKHLTTRTVQKIFQNACKIAGIRKDVNVYSFRHCFATHLLESGIDLRYIQELLGHKSSKTTEIYTHVTTKNLSAIKSSLDSIFERGET